jgi:Luciferase/Sigma-70 region 2
VEVVTQQRRTVVERDQLGDRAVPAPPSPPGEGGLPHAWIGSEAEDALQEAWLRLGRSQQEAINNPQAWLTTIVGRVCIDMLRARGARREDYVGAWVPEPIVAVRTWATFGPRLAGLCEPAFVNGQVGLLIEAAHTRLGAVGFSIVSSLIATIDLTLDPEKLEMLSGEDDADGSDPTRSPEAVSPLDLRGGPGSAADRIIAEALRWPGVRRVRGHLGSVALRSKQGELGHLHGDVAADVPLPGGLFGHIEDTAAPEQRWASPAPGWVSIPLDTERGIQDAPEHLAVQFGGFGAEQHESNLLHML